MNLSYTAGIIDGESCVRLKKCGSYGYHYLDVEVENINFNLISWLKKTYGGNIYKQERSGNRQTIYRWGLFGTKAYIFFKLIRPYVIVKQDAIDNCIEYYKEVIDNGNRNNIEEFIRRSHEYNKKGRGKDLNSS